MELKQGNFKGIVKSHGRVTHEGVFETQEELEAWYNKHSNRGTFGRGFTYTVEDLSIERETEAAREERKALLLQELKAMTEAEWKGVNSIIECKTIMQKIVEVL